MLRGYQNTEYWVLGDNVESLGSLSLSPHETKISADTTTAKREKIFLIDLVEL